MTRVLVTGTGAVIGYGVLRALKADGDGIATVAADVFPDAAGRHFADAFETAPYTSDPDYGAWLSDVVERHQIDLVIPAIEQDVEWLASVVENEVERPSVPLALNTPSLIRLSTDKGEFDRALHARALPCRIPTRHSGTFEELADEFGLPFLLKPRRGYASKGIVLVRSLEDFAPLRLQLGSELIAQQHVGNPDAEFTVSAFCSKGGLVRALIALRRKLGPAGATAKATLVASDPFRETIEDLCRAFLPEGPTNFQFRLDGGQPMLLEINPRISSATSIRRLFGMNEARMCVDHYVHGHTIEQPVLKSGSVVRILEDIVTYDDRPDL